MAYTWTFQRSVEIILSAGIKEKGRQKAREDPEELDMHLLILGWGLYGDWQCPLWGIHLASEGVAARLALQLQ